MAERAGGSYERRRNSDFMLQEVVNEVAKLREEVKAATEGVDRLLKSQEKFNEAYKPYLDESIEDKLWWKQTLSEAKRKGLITLLSVAVTFAIGGFFLGFQSGWKKAFLP